MVQVTLRLPDELVRAIKDAARERDESVNAWATRVLAAAVDPDLAGDEVERIRQRLRRAGLLAEAASEAPEPVTDSDELAKARRAAGTGTPLSDLVAEGRR